LLSILEITFWRVTPDPSYSAAYTGNTARSMLLFLVGIPIFYIGEAIHRDRDFRIDSLLWSQPITNYTLLFAKFLSTLLLMLGFIFSVGLLSIVLQMVKGNGPLELTAYLSVYFLILIPNAIFLAAAFLFLHVLMRNRYLGYAVAIAACVGLFYLYTQGYLHPAYNPLLYKLWSYNELIAGSHRQGILLQRGYVLALATLFIVVAHLVHPRAGLATLWRSWLTVRRNGH
jgi:ABC-2 type transport system permease protein